MQPACTYGVSTVDLPKSRFGTLQNLRLFLVSVCNTTIVTLDWFYSELVKAPNSKIIQVNFFVYAFRLDVNIQYFE